MDVKEAAAKYIARGWQVVPLSPGKKGCYAPNWEKIIFKPEDFKENDNIGIKSIGGLVDIDLDCEEVVAVADHFLPKTGAVYGRKSKPKSHRLYKSNITSPVAITDTGSTVKATLIEIRVNHQSMAPPSIHPSDEPVEWFADGEAAEVSADALDRSVRVLATCALLARYYGPKGMRHLWTMPVAGVLKTLGLTEAEATACHTHAGALANDEEIKDRLELVRATYSRVAEPVAGATMLKDITGDSGKQLYEALTKVWGTSGSGKDARGFITSAKGAALPNNLQNLLLAFRKMGIEGYHDVFTNKIIVNNRPFEDAVLDNILIELEARFGFQSSEVKVKRVLEDLARRNPRHPVREYLDSLTWDQSPRVETWLIEYGDAPDSPYVRAIGKIVLVAAVRRVRVPGCKFDEMLILESEQGWDKSTALRALCPREDWFSEDVSLGLSSKETIETTSGCWIIEASELKGLKGRGQDKLKTFLSRQKDGPVRMAYAKLPIEVPRQFIIIGTTNSTGGYLRDITGNRRYWPVEVGHFDSAKLKEDRDQIWAEAAYLEKNRTPIRLDPKLYGVAGVEQEQRRGEDPWEKILESKFGKKDQVTYEEAWDLLAIPTERLTRDIQSRLHDIMQRLGFRKNRPIKRDGKVAKGWVRVSDRTSTPLF